MGAGRLEQNSRCAIMPTDSLQITKRFDAEAGAADGADDPNGLNPIPARVLVCYNVGP